MDVNVNSKFIRSERLKRAWSQEHLAHVAGLGLRTVQRIENTGVASYESVKAIASALEVSAADLTVTEAVLQKPKHPKLSRRAAIAGIFTTLVASLSFLVVRTAFAEQVMLDVGVSKNEESISTSRLLTDNEAEAEIFLDDLLRFVVTPRIEDSGDVFLTVHIYKHDGNEYVRVSEPRLLVRDREPAELRFGSAEGDTFYFRITPQVQ